MVIQRRSMETPLGIYAMGHVISRNTECDGVESGD